MNSFRRVEALGLALLLIGGGAVAAQPVIYQATGTREQIQPVIDQFEHDIIYGVGGDQHNPPQFLGRFELATFDDVAPGSVSTTQTNHLTSGGILFFVSPEGKLQLSAGSGSNQLFGDINPTYPSQLQAFSAPSVLANTTPLSLNDWLFFGKPQGWDAVGAVFANVTTPGSAGFFGSPGSPLYPAETTSSDGLFSFLGIIDPKMQEGNVPIDLPSLGTAIEATAVDDVFVGIAPPLPEPCSISLLLVGGLVLWVTLRFQGRPG